jgi:acyl-lipid omega-6 desaturase (Delta-12 desaturase)
MSANTTSEKADDSPAQAENDAATAADDVNWKAIVAEHQEPRFGAACWQIFNSVGAYLAMWWIMYQTMQISWWLTMPLALIAGGLLVRIFIIFHDCGHGSFFKSRLANDVWGFITGMMAFTPYQHWRWEHAVHHATNGDLDRRGVGDVWTMTVTEYLAASKGKRLAYRLVRHPIVLFGFGPIFLFLIRERLPVAGAKTRDKISVWIMNVAIVFWSAVLISYVGFWPWVILQLTILAVGASAGVWLFYVQHQFEETYWKRGEEWDFLDAALKGSSFYKLPRILQWFTGNIGYHHIHHLSSRIPNYNLERCHKSHPMFMEVKPLTFWASLKTMTYRLWDEKNMKLISFGQLKRQLAAQAIGG